MNPAGFTAVVTAAGHATRFRPFSAAVPKEMLPIGARPALDHVITECLGAGATHVIVVTRPDDEIVPAYVRMLRSFGGLPVEAVPEDPGHGYGNGTPLMTVRDRLPKQAPFAVAFGDDVLLHSGNRPGADLAALYQLAVGGADAAIAGQLINPADAGSFGIIGTRQGDPTRVTGIRQRPDPDTVAGPLAVVSRLVLHASILDHLVPADSARGEVDLGVAVGLLATRADVRIHRIATHWVTVGDPSHYTTALNTYAHLRQATRM